MKIYIQNDLTPIANIVLACFKERDAITKYTNENGKFFIFTQTELVEKYGFTRSYLTKTFKELQEKGYVTLTKVNNVNQFALTGKGTFDKFFVLHQEIVNDEKLCWNEKLVYAYFVTLHRISKMIDDEMNKFFLVYSDDLEKYFGFSNVTKIKILKNLVEIGYIHKRKNTIRLDMKTNPFPYLRKIEVFSNLKGDN